MSITKKSRKRIQEQSVKQTDPVTRIAGRSSEKIRARLDELFADIKRLSHDPAGKSPEIRMEIEALRARLAELEKEILEIKDPVALSVVKVQATSSVAMPEPATVEIQPTPAAEIQETPPSTLQKPMILYEQEKIGFVFSEGRLLQVRDPGELPNVPTSISIPLTTSGQPIGKVQLALPAEKTWTPEETGLVDSVAQQVSLQIQNLRLLAETERARTEAESATRRYMHEGWESYLDAIHQNERIGFAYDQASVEPFSDEPVLESGIQETVSVMDEQIGTIYLAPDPEHPLAESDRQMVSAIANQIAQQVENIRLLADASRARAEVDATIKQITRENWDSFTNQKEGESLGFAYDTNQVKPFGDHLPGGVALSLPLRVRGETIGQLAVTGELNLSPEATDLAEAIAQQTSAHLETLRLNEELQKRAAELLELDRLKMGFLANMSHELRTPLNSILGFSDVILDGLDGPLTPNMSSDLLLIQKNGQHLLHLINDVLDMAKITAGKMNLNPEPVRVHEILDEVTSITSTFASEKNLSLYIEPDSDQNVEIVADRTRLRQVMINLVNNAIKFTEKGHIAIRVDKKADENILISVQDTGIGIPQDKLEVIFQEFTQVDISSTRKAGGTGLGLPISRRLVGMHGGALWAESAGLPGEGSTFFVRLPLVARITDVVEKQEK
jgi:signal transduction histidine kinase